MNSFNRTCRSLCEHTKLRLPFDGDSPVHEFVHPADEEFGLGFGRFEVPAGGGGGFDQLLGVVHCGVAEKALVASGPREPALLFNAPGFGLGVIDSG